MIIVRACGTLQAQLFQTRVIIYTRSQGIYHW